MTEVDVKLGRQIRRLREQLGMSQEELAKSLVINPNLLSIRSRPEARV